MSKILKIWQQYSWAFHVIGLLTTLAFTAGIVWANVGGYNDRIVALETKQTKQEKVLMRTDYNVQIIARRIGLRPLEKGEDE